MRIAQANNIANPDLIHPGQDPAHTLIPTQPASTTLPSSAELASSGCAGRTRTV